MCVRGNPDFCKQNIHHPSGLILYLLSSFLVTSILWSNLKENCLNLLSADIFEMLLNKFFHLLAKGGQCLDHD